jgi:hypothetical protein
MLEHSLKLCLGLERLLKRGSVMGRRTIHVQTVIRADMETVWHYTEDPALHQRWDLRFSEITYQSGSSGRFRYSSRLLGRTITGTGVSAGERERADGSRTSALRFASDDTRSLIRSGAGYWRYTPTPAGVCFATGFDYTTRWGPLGPLADLVFRPLFAWATAWSFDRLRLWLETGVAPEVLPLLSPSAGRCRRQVRHGRHLAAPGLLAEVEQP